MVNQRWRDRRASYCPAGEVIATQRYEVAIIPDNKTAKQFIITHHYSGTYPAARFRFALWQGPHLHGVAVFSHPVNNLTLTNLFPCELRAAVELGRFVLLDEVPGNGETWFLGRCFELLRRASIEGVVSFSDPQPRRTDQGIVVFPGHIGTIYQAHNARYLGRSTRHPQYVLPDGTIFSQRAIQKLRAREQGWRYAAAVLRRFGADEPGEDLDAWRRCWMAKLTRCQPHPGNHKYAWGLTRAIQRCLPASLPYPKVRIPA